MKAKIGTSEYFIVTAIIFEDDEEAECCDHRIATLKAECGKGEGFEFRFSRCCDEMRSTFLAAVSGCSFFYYSLVLNKAKLYSKGFHNKESLYKYTTHLVFENAKPILRNAKVTIDQCGERQFRESLSKYLKRKMNEPGDTLIKKVKMERSHSNNLLQLADMVCGAVAKSFKRTDTDGRSFRRMIKHREGRVQVWPR